MSLLFALVNGLDFSSYYIFYGGLFFALIWVTGLRWLYERLTGLALRALGRSRRAIAGRPRQQIDAVAHALLADTTRHALRAGRLHLADARSPTTACATSARSSELPQLLAEHACRRS